MSQYNATKDACLNQSTLGVCGVCNRYHYLRENTAQTVFGIPISITKALKPGQVVVLTIEQVNSILPGLSPTFAGPVRVINEPYAIVTGDDLKLLDALHEIRRLNREEDRWRQAHEKQSAVCDLAVKSLQEAETLAHEARQKRREIINQL